jgi:hypothetical protein
MQCSYKIYIYIYRGRERERERERVIEEEFGNYFLVRQQYNEVSN